MNKSAIFFIYNSLGDPLIQNTVIKYLNTFSEENKCRVYLITFEQKEYWIPDSERKKIIIDLEKNNIDWIPFKYHTGHLIILKKFYHLLLSFFVVGFLSIFRKSKLIFAFANVAGSYAFLLSKIFRLKLIIYSFEPHAQFMADLKVWSINSLKFKLLNFLEWKAGLYGDYILTGTKHMVKELNIRKAKGRVFRVPTGVDENDFYFRPYARKNIREKMNLTERKVIIYIGKFGDLYETPAKVLEFVKYLMLQDPRFYFIIITSYDLKKLKLELVKLHFSENDYHIDQNIPYDQVKEFISAADIGLSIVPYGEKQKFRSPTKVGEYLLCGLPYITCIGVSEDDEYAIDYKIGIVIENYSKSSGIQAFEKIRHLLKEDKKKLRERCQKVGKEYHGKSNVDKLLKEIYLEVF